MFVKLNRQKMLDLIETIDFRNLEWFWRRVREAQASEAQSQ
ncbi:hypothetical protein ALICE_223 [Mycobacterium phage Alice]|uniref:Uncharacterized protein n=2 Tax=Bixzunavirus alice TaxID=2006133 RepID=A0A411AZH2_9CAUD|nr:hypothetical protein ALICE_223 [Mycobacterium phage Alice]AEJ94447.1 hypothetical protein ALICE_223 [Mycobacterium phage Alice]AXN54021.1 hypothetical protein SEA_RABINOVISH_229 [Mycobacterium phage Rabinovish]QAX93503.1 hypothetical protein SEA_STUBBY_220 [Mycobacterium phage Stubby]UEM46253.1 hypothetical protein SEA_PINKCREEK_218 [Mycobacterium phage Pinkcreek]